MFPGKPGKVDPKLEEVLGSSEKVDAESEKGAAKSEKLALNHYASFYMVLHKTYQ